jgi:hypothetical protein
MRLTFVVPAARLGQQLFVRYWDVVHGEWVVLELTDIDPLAGRVSVYVTQTGIYVLGAAELVRLHCCSSWQSGQRIPYPFDETVSVARLFLLTKLT